MNPDPELVELARRTAGQVLAAPVELAVVAFARDRVTVRCQSGARAVAAKVYGQPDRLRLDADHAALARKAGVPVPAQLLFEPGPPAILILEWVDGDPIGRHPAAARQLGGLLAGYKQARKPHSGAAADWHREVRRRGETELARGRGLGLLEGLDQPALADRLDALAASVTGRPQALVHGDLQTEHVLVDPLTGTIAGIIDWADSGIADPLFEVARLSLSQQELEQPFLEGLALHDAGGLVNGYRLLWWLMSSIWLAEQGFTSAAAQAVQNLQQLLSAEI